MVEIINCAAKAFSVSHIFRSLVLLAIRKMTIWRNTLELFMRLHCFVPFHRLGFLSKLEENIHAEVNFLCFTSNFSMEFFSFFKVFFSLHSFLLSAIKVQFVTRGTNSYHIVLFWAMVVHLMSILGLVKVSFYCFEKWFSKFKNMIFIDIITNWRSR